MYLDPESGLCTWIKRNVRTMLLDLLVGWTMFLDPMLGMPLDPKLAGRCFWIPCCRCWACIWIQCWLEDVSGSHAGHVSGSKVGWTMFLDPMLGMHLDIKLAGRCFWIPCWACTWIQCWLDNVSESLVRVELCIWIPSDGWKIYLDPIFWRGWRSSHLVWDLKAIETCCSEISKIRFFSSKVKKNIISSIFSTLSCTWLTLTQTFSRKKFPDCKYFVN